MSVKDIATFSDPNEARQAYFGDQAQGGGPSSTDPASGWQRARQVDRLEGGWQLFSQTRQESDRTRWFVIGGPDGAQVLRPSGQAEAIPEGAGFDELPSMETEENARQAHQTWLESDQSSSSWSSWNKVGERPPWHLYSRTKGDGDKQQWIAKGVLPDGTEVHLADGGEVRERKFVFKSRSALETAIDAYNAKADSGDIPDDRQPTGSSPSLPEGGPSSSDDSSSTIGRLASLAFGNPLLLVAIAVVIYVVYTRYVADSGGEMDG